VDEMQSFRIGAHPFRNQCRGRASGVRTRVPATGVPVQKPMPRQRVAFRLVSAAASGTHPGASLIDCGSALQENQPKPPKLLSRSSRSDGIVWTSCGVAVHGSPALQPSSPPSKDRVDVKSRGRRPRRQGAGMALPSMKDVRGCEFPQPLFQQFK